MAVSKGHSNKSPSQNPNDFYEGRQQGGSQGKPSSVPEQLKSGPMKEKVMGHKSKKK